MQRPTVRVTRMRIRDLRPGDVVNRDPESMQGWFAVTELRPLHDGTVSVVSRVITMTFSGHPDDLVGVQVLVPMEFPEPAPTAAAPPPAATAPRPLAGPNAGAIPTPAPAGA